MPLTREQKEEIVEELKDKIDRHQSITFVNFEGLGVKDFTELRKRLKEVGGEVKVVKKTLAEIAFDKAEIDLRDYEGQVALVFGFEDKVRSVKAAHEMERETEMELVGGYFDDRFVEREEMRKIAELPGRKELLEQLTRAVADPISGLVTTLQGNIKGLVYTLKAIQAEKNG